MFCISHHKYVCNVLFAITIFLMPLQIYHPLQQTSNIVVLPRAENQFLTQSVLFKSYMPVWHFPYGHYRAVNIQYTHTDSHIHTHTHRYTYLIFPCMVLNLPSHEVLCTVYTPNLPFLGVLWCFQCGGGIDNLLLYFILQCVYTHKVKVITQARIANVQTVAS